MHHRGSTNNSREPSRREVQGAGGSFKSQSPVRESKRGWRPGERDGHNERCADSKSKERNFNFQGASTGKQK